MRRAVLLIAAVAAVVTVAAPAQATKRSLRFTVKLVQEETLRHHISAAHSNDTFSTTLRLFAIGEEFGVRDATRVGTMAFDWGPLKGRCSNHSAGCQGTTNISTFTQLPGGTITAGGKNISLSGGIVVPINGGTGAFKGARGTIQIAPAWAPREIFDVILPG
jgi:hypothetical protein